MTAHGSQSGQSIHTQVRWHHASAQERLAEQVTEADVGKRSLQLEDLSLWDLVSAAPKVWVQTGGQERDLGDSGPAVTVDFRRGVRQRVRITEACTVTVTARAGATGQLVLEQDETGGHSVAFGGGSYVWGQGVSDVGQAPGARDIATIYFDGALFWGVITNFS